MQQPSGKAKNHPSPPAAEPHGEELYLSLSPPECPLVAAVMPCLGFPLCSGPLRNTTPQKESWPSPLKGASHPVTRVSWLITNPQSLLELTRTIPTGWSQQHSHRCGMSVPSILLICCFLQATLGQERYKAVCPAHPLRSGACAGTTICYWKLLAVGLSNAKADTQRFLPGLGFPFSWCLALKDLRR